MVLYLSLAGRDGKKILAAITRHGRAKPGHDGRLCRLHDDPLVDRTNVFIFEVVKAHVAPRSNHPETLHYSCDGTFMVSGKIITRRLFRPEMLSGLRLAVL